MIIIILDDSNEVPLSGTEAIMVLTQTQSLTALESAGLAANIFETPGK